MPFGSLAGAHGAGTLSRALSWGSGLILLAALSIGPADDPAKIRSPLVVSGKVEYEYVGTKKCRSCHGKWHESWKASAKGRSWDALKPGKGSAVKRHAGLQTEKDYRSDVRCLKCHSTGFGHETGYAIPDPDNGRSVRSARKREGVGCESCHGSGSGFVMIMRDILWNERPYRQDELRAAGLQKITREDCLRCHTLKATCIVPDGKGGTSPKGALDVALQDRAGFHSKFPIEHRIPDEADVRPAPTPQG